LLQQPIIDAHLPLQIKTRPQGFPHKTLMPDQLYNSNKKCGSVIFIVTVKL